MHDQLSITKCVLLLLNFQNVAQSFRLYQLNDVTENEFVNQLRTIIKKNEKPSQVNVLDIIDSDLKDERKNNVNVRTRIYSGRRIEDGFKTPMLVKRIIPHDYKMGKYEYDSKLKTIYRPLIRVHVKKPMSEVENDIMNGKSPNRNGYLMLIKNRNSPKNDLVQQIKNVINKKPMPDDLRSMFDKSGEQNDPFAPGKYGMLEEVVIVTQTPKPMPKYPFWNYWTYDKNVHIDDCPGSQIKVGNICMGMINK